VYTALCPWDTVQPKRVVLVSVTGKEEEITWWWDYIDGGLMMSSQTN